MTNYIKEKIVKKMHNDVTVTDENIQATAEQYLLREVGLRESELSALKMVLSSSTF